MKKASILLILTAVFAAAGVYVRRLALLGGFDADGLAVRGFYAHTVLIVLSAVLLCALLCAALSVRRSRDAGAQALSSGAPALVFEIIAAVLMLAAGAFSLIQGGLVLSFGAILGCFALVGAVCLGLFAFNAYRDRPESGGVPILIVALFSAFWLICTFKANGNDPVLAAFAYQILGVACACLACYFTAGFCVNIAKPRLTAFFSMAAVYFLAVAAVNSASMSELLLSCAFILFLASRSCSIIKNVSPGRAGS